MAEKKIDSPSVTTFSARAESKCTVRFINRKEAAKPLPAGTPITIQASKAHRHVAETHEPKRRGRATWRPVFQPCMLGIVVLAAAVFAWGLGYKMSLYRQQVHAAPRIPVAKLWVKPRGTLAVRAARLILKTQVDSSSRACPILSLRIPTIQCATVPIAVAFARWGGNFKYSIPFRGPPQHRFAFA